MNKATCELLEQHFDTAFAAPDGVKRLRELILTLAMQGKLVTQDPNDPPASQLLNEIEAEKNRLVKEGKIKAPKPLPEIKPREVQYALPQGWKWVRLGELFKIVYGKGLPTANLTNEGYDVFGANGIIGKYSKYLYEEPQLLVSCRGAYSGKPNLSPPLCFVTSNSLVLENSWEYLNLHFFYYAIEIADKTKIVTGSAQPQVTTTNLEPFIVPLPPLPEQRRIVAKIEQLMARCDELEKLRAEREQRRLSVHAAAINRLTSPTASFPRRRESMTAENLAFRPCALEGMRGNDDGMDRLNEAWQFITQHFAELYAVKPNVADLRKAILQLAVMGKLVPQNPNDPSASEILKEIEAEKLRLMKEGKIKLSKPLQQIDNDEQEFELPSGWAWSRLQNVLDVRDGTHDSPKDAVGPNTYPLVTSKNFVDGMIDFSGARRISSEDHFEIIKRSEVEKYDILFSMIGGNIGNQVIVEEEREFSIKNVALFKYYSRDLTNPYFIKRFMEHLAINLQTKAAGGAQPFVSLGFLRNLVIALPPLPEQHRIVAKVDSLMALCDTLEQQIDAAASKQTALLDAVMAQV